MPPFGSLVEGALLLLVAVALCPTESAGHEFDSTTPSTVVYEAVLNLTYWDRATGAWRPRDWARGPPVGVYAADGRVEPEWGRVVHVRAADERTDGCQRPANVLPPGPDRWIALVQKENCGVHQKVGNAVAAIENITAVVVYGHDLETEAHLYKRKGDDVVVIFISKQSGESIASLADNATLKLTMHISLGRQRHLPYSHINKTSVLFVAISFIVLMAISLAWLIFYYVQRFRYTHTKDRLTKRLTSAAKKALNRIPLKTIKKTDIDLLDAEFDLCAICVENYKVSDVVRLLACRHVFHKSCVDPWLLEQRTCPICKMDILQACGLQVLPGQDSTAMARAERHQMYLEASTLLLDDNNLRLHPVEMTLLCPRPPADDTTVAEIVNESNAESLSDIVTAIDEYPQCQQTTV